jgi:hypothetical protein
MRLLTPNEIRAIDNGEQWQKAYAMVKTNKAMFTKKQWEAIKSAFAESRKVKK